jgi:ribonucleoside-diphosphate reductase alpha chain
MTAIEQLENWLCWKRNWAEHSVSATIYVEPYEWFQVGSWVYDHFDEITGLSFLPKDNGVYKHAPNEELTADQYAMFSKDFPVVDWSKLCQYEDDDQTESAQNYACVGGACAF